MHLTGIKRHIPVIAVAALLVSTVAAILTYSYWHSQLPPVSIRGDRVMCHMKYCDFQFPLPSGARDVTIGQVTVGPDTITGSIIVGESDRAVSYDEILRKHNFNWKLPSPMAMSIDQPGGWVWPVSGGRIDFSYFGDR
jgi:hypothetical protein